MLIYQRKLIVQPEITGDLLKLLFVIYCLADASGDDGYHGIGTELTEEGLPNQRDEPHGHDSGPLRSEVYKIVSYHAPLNNEAIELFVENMRKYGPDHQPCWTAVGVQQLGGDDMRVEIDVKAHSPK